MRSGCVLWRRKSACPLSSWRRDSTSGYASIALVQFLMLTYISQFGNNRGNKYSKKSIHHPSTSNKFWDFSMDEFAFHDIPDSINYVLATTKQKSLSYIGFSQGTAQAFATLSIHPALNDKVDVFIALAPAMSPAGLYNPIVDALMKTSPNIMFLFFGRKSILSSTTFWQSILCGFPLFFISRLLRPLTHTRRSSHLRSSH